MKQDGTKSGLSSPVDGEGWPFFWLIKTLEHLVAFLVYQFSSLAISLFEFSHSRVDVLSL